MAKKNTDPTWGDWKKTVDPLNPSMSLLIKLGSAVVHADEFLSPNGHPVDKSAFAQLVVDVEVSEWIESMTKQGFLPVKR